MPSTTRQARGAAAESAVLERARQQGLRCLTRNFRRPGGELDLVLDDGETVIVVEVRQRSRSDYGRAVETVTARKQQRLIHAARCLLQARPALAARPLRFDVVGVGPDGALEWIEDAFQLD